MSALLSLSFLLSNKRESDDRDDLFFQCDALSVSLSCADALLTHGTARAGRDSADRMPGDSPAVRESVGPSAAPCLSRTKASLRDSDVCTGGRYRSAIDMHAGQAGMRCSAGQGGQDKGQGSDAVRGARRRQKHGSQGGGWDDASL